MANPTIHIDAVMDTSGVSRGTSKISNSVLRLSRAFGIMSGSSVRSVRAVGYALDNMAASSLGNLGVLSVGLMGVFAVAALALAGLVGLVAGSIRTFYQLDGSVQGLKDSFGDLKNAFAVAFAPLLTFAVPYIQAVISWLIKLFNTIAMVVGALLGQTAVWQAVEGGTAQANAAAAADKLAKNTKKAKKEAEGALAAWDQLNVLAKKTAEEPVAGTGAGGVGTGLNGPGFTLTPITSEIQQKADNIRAIFTRLWEDLKKDPKLFFQDLWVIISTVATAVWNDLVRIWGQISPWVQANVTDPIGQWFQTAWANIGLWAADAWEWIKLKASEAWLFIQSVWAAAVAWFRTNITDPLREAFGIAFDGIRSKFETVFAGLQNFARGIFNGVIGLINGLLVRIANGINQVIYSLNKVGGILPGWQMVPYVNAGSIPYLAQGAVVPAHANLLAMIGEGNRPEIVAPDETIRRIIREELGAAGGDTVANITLQLDGETIYRNQQRISRRRGPSLVVENAA